MIFGKRNPFSGGKHVKAGSRQFLAVALEQMWLIRNKIRLGANPPDWSEFVMLVNQAFHRYWKRIMVINSRHHNLAYHPKSWLPPLPGEFKINFDAAFKDGMASLGVVLRDSVEIIRGSWINRFRAVNAFCVEVEVAVQAFQVTEALQLDKVSFEGDAHNVIMTILGCSQFEDWKVETIMETGKVLFNCRLFWRLVFAHRSCNLAAHELAKWAFSSDFSGQVDLSILPSTFWPQELAT